MALIIAVLLLLPNILYLLYTSWDKPAVICRLVVDSEEKLCRLVSELGKVCERRKLTVNVCKSEVMRCSRYGKLDRMHVILNLEPLEEVDCFKYLGSQVAADGGCERDVVHRMNERM